MKYTVQKIIEEKQNKGIEIEGATLLSAEEADKLPMKLRKYNNWWWLRSSGELQDYAAIVDCVGSVYYDGIYVSYDDNCVRPALKISNLGTFDIGDKFIFGDKKFIVIDKDLAFCLEDIGECAFNIVNRKGNNYETSDIKKYVDKWFESVK